MKKYLLPALLLLIVFTGCFGRSHKNASLTAPERDRLQYNQQNPNSKLELVRSEAELLEDYRRNKDRQSSVEFAGRS